MVLTKKGLDYAAVALVDFLEEKIKGARIDDIAGTTETIIAYIDYWFKDTIVSGFLIKQSLGLRLGLGLRWAS